MKLSNLIEELRFFMNRYGDVEVVVRNDQTGKTGNVSYSEEICGENGETSRIAVAARRMA